MNDIPNSPAAPASLSDHVEHVSASVVGLATRRHRGSGVWWRDGVVVTSASALWRASSVSVVLPDGEQVAGEIRGIDGMTDLAAVTVSAPATASAAATSSAAASTPAAASTSAAATRPTDVATPRVGDFVFAVGRDPSGLVQASFGHIGAVAGAWRTWRGGRIDSLIRLDGGLYPGLSGAPVANASGQVLGIASSAFSRHHGVVVPTATIDRVIEQLLSHGRVRHGYLGIAVQPARATLDGTAVDGLLVTSVANGGPAEQGGLLVGDVIVDVGGTPARSLDALRDLLQVGAQVDVRVVRGGQARQLSLQVAQRPSSGCH